VCTVCFAAIERRAEGRYQKTHFSRPKAHTNRAAKQMEQQQ
jgi:hypothetical protein